MELQFNERGRMVGCKLLNYLLDKRRVTIATKTECNFNIFYTLLQGASPEEQSTLSLTDVSHYDYTKHTFNTISTEDVIESYDALRASMKHLGLGKRYHTKIMQLIASLLHLGQLRFIDDPTMQQEAAFVKNVDTLELVSDFLGVDPGALENVLTYRTQLIKNDVTTLILDAAQASDQRDELVVALYHLLFVWLIEHMNSKLCHDNIHSFIDILDLSGMDIGKTKETRCDFDRLCSNWANEKLQNYILRYVFQSSGIEYSQDGFDLPSVNFVDNSPCIDFFDQPRHGFIDIINSFSKKQVAVKDEHSTNRAILETTVKYQSGNDSFELKKAETGATYFVIQHFTGPQSYQPDGFIECNRDVLNPDFVSLFKGSSDLQPSTNTFLVNLFQDKSVTIKSHPNHAEAIMSAQLSNKPNRLPSLRRSKSIKNREFVTPVETKTKKVVPLVLGQLRSSLDELFATLDETMPWFVFCIKANDGTGKDIGFDSRLVQSQIQSFNLAPIATRMKTGAYSNIMLHSEFCERYQDILSINGVEMDKLPRSKCQALVDIFGWSVTNEAAVGNSKVRACLVVHIQLNTHLMLDRYF